MGFDQSEHAQGPIYILKRHKRVGRFIRLTEEIKKLSFEGC